MPKDPETNSTAEEAAELDAEFERQLAATLAMDPVERVDVYKRQGRERCPELLGVKSL